MNDDIAISVDNLSKKFARSMKKAMWYGLVDIARASLIPHRYRSKHFATRLHDHSNAALGAQRLAKPSRAEVSDLTVRSSDDLRSSEFWALRDISFELRKGECLGVIGHNGAGKSTLFSILSGIYGPSEGRVQVRGRLQALIALGAGFHPMLTGRENIYINAAVLGLTGRQIDNLLDEVIEFSEVGEFIDMPVKRYSSGMMVRLGFSVAVHMKPDVLLVDEVLSVGDLAFRNRSFKKMMELVDSDVSVLFVSHSMPAVEHICTRVIWLEKGAIKAAGDTNEVVLAYQKNMLGNVDYGVGIKHGEPDSSIYITNAEVLDYKKDSATVFPVGGSVIVAIDYEVISSCVPLFHIEIRRKGSQETLCSAHMKQKGEPQPFCIGKGKLCCNLLLESLALGSYILSVGIHRSTSTHLGSKFFVRAFDFGEFSIEGKPEDVGCPGYTESQCERMSPMLIPHSWIVN